MVIIRAETIVKPLSRGDEFIVAAASSAIHDEKALLEGLKILNEWGLVCLENNVVGRYWGYLAGNDKTRSNDLRPKKNAPLIAFARGGWGSARLLEHCQQWKKGILLGFSDVSSLLLARLSDGFDGCIHGPMLTTLGREPLWSKQRLEALLFGKSVPALAGEGWNKGIARGPIVVSNLAVGSHLIGTKYMPNLKGAILILEDVGEAPYRVDRMLTHWRLAGLLQDLAGLGFGNFKKCSDNEDIDIDKTFQLTEILRERSQDLNIPVVGNLPIGHCLGNAALPLGHQAMIDGNEGSLMLLPE